MKIFRLVFIILLISGCQEKDLSRKIIDGKLEPPAPNEEENEKTLLGVDVNQNGIRDDVERWINRKFPKDEDYNLRMLYKQVAKEMNLMLHAHKRLNQKEVRKYFDDTGKASSCAGYIYGILLDDRSGFIKKKPITDALHTKTYNTSERLRHREEFEAKFDGFSAVVPHLSEGYKYCDFKVRK